MKLKNIAGGFTLIELLVVVSIVSLLSSMVTASLGSAREKARIAAGAQFEANMYHAYGANAVGIWNFDEGSGGAGTIINDSSGNGFNGTLGNNLTWVTGISGSAISRTSNFQGAIIEPPYSLGARNDLVGGPNGSILVTAWIQPTNTAGNGVFVCGFPGISYFSYSSSLNKIQLMIAGQSTYEISNGNISRDKWTHVGFLLEGGVGYKFYIDGKLDKEVKNASLQIVNIAFPSWTGIGSSCLGGGSFIGSIDSVRAYYAAI